MIDFKIIENYKRVVQEKRRRIFEIILEYIEKSLRSLTLQCEVLNYQESTLKNI